MGRQSGCDTRGMWVGGPGQPWKECPRRSWKEARPQKPDSHFLQNLGKQGPLGPRFCAPRTLGPVCEGSEVRGRHLWPLRVALSKSLHL